MKNSIHSIDLFQRINYLRQWIADLAALKPAPTSYTKIIAEGQLLAVEVAEIRATIHKSRMLREIRILQRSVDNMLSTLNSEIERCTNEFLFEFDFTIKNLKSTKDNLSAYLYYEQEHDEKLLEHYLAEYQAFKACASQLWLYFENSIAQYKTIIAPEDVIISYNSIIAMRKKWALDSAVHQKTAKEIEWFLQITQQVHQESELPSLLEELDSVNRSLIEDIVDLHAYISRHVQALDATLKQIKLTLHTQVRSKQNRFKDLSYTVKQMQVMLQRVWIQETVEEVVQLLDETLELYQRASDLYAEWVP